MRPLLSFISLILLFAFGTYWFHIRSPEQVAPEYRKLVQESRELRSKQPLERHPATQARENVQKDIWIRNGEENRHICLKGKLSQLAIQQKKEQVAIQEELQEIDCIIQDGSELHQTHAFLADAGTFDPLKKDFFCQGNIRFFYHQVEKQPSFASADTLEYLPASRQFLLTAFSPHRVLYWQEGFCLSAPQVKIHPDPKQGIEGIGDVHFTFEPEEKAFFDALFSRYL